VATDAFLALPIAFQVQAMRIVSAAAIAVRIIFLIKILDSSITHLFLIC
jgi:hypothetical protein